MYVVTPADVGAPPTTGTNRPTRAVIVGHDVCGWDSGRTRLIADRLARALGAVVVLPDFFHGAPWDARNDSLAEGATWRRAWNATKLIAWMKATATNWTGSVGPDTARVAAWLADTHGIGIGADARGSIGLVGFCWGGWWMLHAAALLGERAACCVGFHPSPSAELLRGDAPWARAREALVARAARGGATAILLCPAGNDPSDVQPGGLADRVLRRTTARTPYPHAVRAFPAQHHGWVNRGDLACPAVARDAEAALALGTAFLRCHLGEDDAGRGTWTPCSGAVAATADECSNCHGSSKL